MNLVDQIIWQVMRKELTNPLTSPTNPCYNQNVRKLKIEKEKYMKNIALIYRGQKNHGIFNSIHASHRLINATIEQYKSNYKHCQELFSLHVYCLDKKNQLRFDRFLERNKIDLVYVHEEEKEFISQLNSYNVEYLTFTRSDFVTRHSASYTYVVEYEYTLIDELISGEKQKHGKVKRYSYSMGEITQHEIYKCDEKKYEKGYYKSEQEAMVAYVKYLEEWKRKEEKKLEDVIKISKNKIKEISVKINKFNKMIEKENE